MIIKRFSSILNTNTLAGFAAKTKSGRPRKLDQKMDRISSGNTALEINKEIRKMGGNLLRSLKNGGDN